MRRPRVATLAGLVLVIGAFVALVWMSLANAVVYYVTPTELAASASTDPVRLYGLVEPGSVRWEGGSSSLSFRVTDGTTTMTVESRALPTGLFQDGIGVVLAGRPMAEGVFVADEILVKHSEVYEPLQPGQTPPADLLESLRDDS